MGNHDSRASKFYLILLVRVSLISGPPSFNLFFMWGNAEIKSRRRVHFLQSFISILSPSNNADSPSICVIILHSLQYWVKGDVRVQHVPYSFTFSYSMHCIIACRAFFLINIVSKKNIDCCWPYFFSFLLPFFSILTMSTFSASEICLNC